MARTESLDPDEKRVITFDFSPELDIDEIINGPLSTSVTVSFGTDGDPQGIIDGAPALDPTSTKVLVPVKGKVDLCDYAIKIVCATTNPSKTLALVATLPIRKAV